MINAKIHELTNRIISDIESGTFSFKYDWKLSGKPPQNFISGHIYKGFNAFILKYFSADTFFLTFLQAKDRNIKIKRDEKGHRIIYWKLLEKKQAQQADEKAKYFPLMKISYVFGLSQTDNFHPDESQSLQIPAPQSVIDNYKYCPALLIGDRRPCFIPIYLYIQSYVWFIEVFR